MKIVDIIITISDLVLTLKTQPSSHRIECLRFKFTRITKPKKNVNKTQQHFRNEIICTFLLLALLYKSLFLNITFFFLYARKYFYVKYENSVN